MDVYALGLVLLESVTGTRPFRIEAPMTPAAAAGLIAARKLESAPLDPGESFPEGLREIVRRATQGDPRARPSSAELHAALRAIGGRDGASPHTVELAPPRAAPAEQTQVVPDPPRRRSRAVYAVIGGIVPALLALGVIFGRGRTGPAPEARPSPPATTVPLTTLRAVPVPPPTRAPEPESEP